MKKILRALILSVLAGGIAADALAQVTGSPRDLTQASIEDLMNIKVTSASRKEERADDFAGAIYVITHEDIRRSGMTTVPDLLRMVPGVQVAQVNANSWAVSVRGFNGLYSNKLLVLVDGRTVYSRLFSGVLWDAEDVVLEDIDRIEVIRGPGAAVWGANAVNGVINILTKSAADTKGALVRVGGGTLEPGQVLARYGGSFGDTAFRVYSQGSAVGASQLAPSTSAGDNWRHGTVGFRGDWVNGGRAFTLEGSLTDARANTLWVNFDPAITPTRPDAVSMTSDMTGGTLLGRWTRTAAGGASLQVQSFIDIAHRDEPVAEYHHRVADLDLQYHTSIGRRHDLVAGTGYRVTYEQFLGRTGYSLTPDTWTNELFNVFAQDEVALVANRLYATLGAKVEHDGLAGWGVQPTARLTWAVVPKRQHLWAATSRALRTPSLAERGVFVDYPPILDAGPLPVRASISGTPDTRTEELVDVETGYRLDLASAATIGVTGFYGRYRHLQTVETLTPAVMFGSDGPFVAAPAVFANLLAANTQGLEIDGHWTPTREWRLDGSYTAFRLTPHLDPASRDPQAALFDGDAAGRQWQLHSGYSFGRRANVDVSLFHVGALERLGVPGYSRADARLEVPLTRRLTASVVGQNLLQPSHVEFADTGATVIQTRVPRSARVQLAWRY